MVFHVKTGRLSCLAVLLVCMALLMTPIFAFAAEGDGDPSRDDDVYRVSRDTEIIYGVYHIDDDVELVIASSLIAPRPTTGDDQDTMLLNPAMCSASITIRMECGTLRSTAFVHRLCTTTNAHLR